jgi:hypothetical protein
MFICPYPTAATQPAPANKKRGAKAGLARTKLTKAMMYYRESGVEKKQKRVGFR